MSNRPPSRTWTTQTRLLTRDKVSSLQTIELMLQTLETPSKSKLITFTHKSCQMRLKRQCKTHRCCQSTLITISLKEIKSLCTTSSSQKSVMTSKSRLTLSKRVSSTILCQPHRMWCSTISTLGRPWAHCSLKTIRLDLNLIWLVSLCRRDWIDQSSWPSFTTSQLITIIERGTN